MNYGSPQDLPTYYDVTYYGLGPEVDQPRAGEHIDPRWYVASQRRRSSGQTQVSLFSEDELDRYATIRPSAARPGVPPGHNYGGLRRKSTNLDRYVNLSESVNTVTDLSAVSEQLLQLSQLQLPRYVPHLAQIPEVTPLSAELALSKDATAVFAETKAPPPTPVPVRVPKMPVPQMESPIIVASALETKSANSGKSAQPNMYFHSASTVRSDPKDLNKAAVYKAVRSKKMFRSDERGDRNWAVLRKDATVHSLPATSVEELDAVPLQKAKPAEQSRHATIAREQSHPQPPPEEYPPQLPPEEVLPHPPPEEFLPPTPPKEFLPQPPEEFLPQPPSLIVSPSDSSQPSGSSETASTSGSTGSSSYSSDYESDTSQSISAFGGTVSKSTRASNNEKPPASITGTPSSVPRTVSSTTMTYTPAKSPDEPASYASKHSPEASKKSGEHRSSAKTPPSQARTPTELLRSKSKTPPSIAATMIRSFRSRSRTPASSAKTRASPRSRSKTPTSITKTTPTSTRPPTPANPTPPPSPRTPTSILRTSQRSSAKTIASQLQAVAAEDQKHMLESGIRDFVIQTSEYALPEHISQRGITDARNPEVENDGFHSQRTFHSRESRLPSIIQPVSRNMESNKRVSSGHFQSTVKQTSYLPSRHSLSQEEAIVPKLTPHSVALIQHGAAPTVRVPVTSVSVPVAKDAQAPKEYSADVSSVSRLPMAAAPMSESLVHCMGTFPQPIRESRRHLKKASSAQTSPKKKSRSSKAIQHPDQTEYVKLPTPEGALDCSNFQSSEGSSGRPHTQPSKDRAAKADGSMLMHLCIAINVILFSALSGIVFAYFLHMGTIRKV